MSLSSTEIMIIALVALIALGPQRLPDALRTAGKYYRQFRDVTGSVQREINSVVNETTGMVTGTAGLVANETAKTTGSMAPATPAAPSTPNEAFRPDQTSPVAPADELPADTATAPADVAPADVAPADELPAEELAADEFPADDLPTDELPAEHPNA